MSASQTPSAPSAPSPETPPVQAAEPSPAPEAPAAAEAEPAAEAEKEEEDRAGASSELRNSISLWISENPEADFDEVARTANRFLRQQGYPMVLDASPLLKPGQNEIRLKSGKRAFVFESGKELSAETDVCGERFLRIPARMLGADEAALVVYQREFPISLKGFRREEFLIYRGNKLISRLKAPEPVEPIGISNNGKALFIRFLLNEHHTASWWAHIGVHQPSVLDEDPYLLLRVEKSRLYFDENIEHLPSQEFEVLRSGPAYRWRFSPSNLVLELASRCD